MATNDHAYPIGHLGYLSEEEATALDAFRELLRSENLITPAVDDKPPSHNDALLLRFLRARRFVPADALDQFRKTERWRKINEVEELYMNIDVDEFEEARRYYTHFVGRRDKRGLPVYLFDIGSLTAEAMAEYAKSASHTDSVPRNNNLADQQKITSSKILRLVAIYENLIGWQTQLSTSLSDRKDAQCPITQTNNIVDISNVGLRQFWSLKSHMQDATDMATSYYPETLDRIFIVGAPRFFPLVWSFVRGLFDPITVSKIFILSEGQTLPILSQYISPESIPKKYGGSLDFKFGDLPTVDPTIADRLTWKDGVSGAYTASGELRHWPKGPIKFTERQDGDWDILAVGTIEGVPRRDVIATFKIGDEIGGWADKSVVHSRHTGSGDVDSKRQQRE